MMGKLGAASRSAVLDVMLGSFLKTGEPVIARNVSTKDGRVIHPLARLQNFKLLTSFVLVSMARGIAIGKVYRISNFAITPPIDVIKSIFHGT